MASTNWKVYVVRGVALFFLVNLIGLYFHSKTALLIIMRKYKLRYKINCRKREVYHSSSYGICMDGN